MPKQTTTYWHLVLDEVVHKDKKEHFKFTNLATKKDQRKRRKKMAKKPGTTFNGIQFSKRESECLHLFTRGKTVRAAAENLGLSPRTVEYYLKNMRAKTKCHSKSELISFIMEQKL